MENSEFSWALDDLMNIHGSWHVVLQVIAPDELIVGAPFGTCLEPGEELTFYAPPYGVKRSVATILDGIPSPGKWRSTHFMTPRYCHVPRKTEFNDSHWAVVDRKSLSLNKL